MIFYEETQKKNLPWRNGFPFPNHRKPCGSLLSLRFCGNPCMDQRKKCVVRFPFCGIAHLCPVSHSFLHTVAVGIRHLRGGNSPSLSFGNHERRMRKMRFHRCRTPPFVLFCILTVAALLLFRLFPADFLFDPPPCGCRNTCFFHTDCTVFSLAYVWGNADPCDSDVLPYPDMCVPLRGTKNYGKSA